MHYVCTEQWFSDGDGRPRKAYRLNLLDIGGREPRLLCAVDDIVGSESGARQLEAYLTRNQVSPRHLMDVLEDLMP